MSEARTDEWDGICKCGKVEMDGVRCRLGATHRALMPWGSGVVTRTDEEMAQMLPKKEKLPWET